MATERTAAPAARKLAEFLKFTRIGQEICGRITKYDVNNNGAFVVLEPVLVHEKGGAWSRYQSAAVGLTADLARKITKDDTGKFVQVVLVDTEPTKQGSDKKIFRVLDLDPDEIRTIASATVDRRSENKPVADFLPEHEAATSRVVDDIFGA